MTSTFSGLVLLAWLCAAVGLGSAHAAAGESPETWIVSGQSNACGRAPLPGYEEHPLVQMFDGKNWVAAKEPLPLGGTVGPWLAAAVETAKAGQAVWITGWAKGGQPIATWDENAPGWTSLKGSIQASGKGAGVFLWYQGENDSIGHITPDAYRAKLANLVGRVRKEAGNPALLAVIIQLASSSEKSTRPMELREAQRQFVAQDPNAILVSALGRPCDGVHLKKEGYFELGREVSRALLKFHYGKKDLDWPGPVLDAAILGADGRSISAHFAEVKQLAGAAAADFAAVDAQGACAAQTVQMGKTTVALTFERPLALPAKLVYGYGSSPAAGLVDEAGNRAPALHLAIATGAPPPDQPTAAPNGAGR